MNTALRTAPHYFVIDSIGGMNEGYSETTCRRIEDVKAPELAKAMVEEYIDQWAHDRLEYYTECIAAETGRTAVGLVRFDIEECPRGGWVKLTPKFDKSLVWVRTITHKSTAIRMAEECISIDVERIKAKVYEVTNHGGWDRHYTNNLIYAYDCLAEVVRGLEYPQDVMVDIDDTCIHYFPVQAMKRMVYTDENRITSE